VGAAFNRIPLLFGGAAANLMLAEAALYYRGCTFCITCNQIASPNFIKARQKLKFSVVLPIQVRTWRNVYHSNSNRKKRRK
jgi:hypothetical protein